MPFSTLARQIILGVKHLFCNESVGLYRDDALGALRNLSDPQT